MGILSKVRTLFRVWDTERFLNNIKFLIKNDIQVTLKDEILEDCLFQLDELRELVMPHVPEILDMHHSLSRLEEQPKSFARFGDGEVAIMQGRDIRFQKYDPALSEKMYRVLQDKRDDMYVGINGLYFHSVRLQNITEEGVAFHYKMDTQLRRFFMEHANPETTYLDATCLCGFFRFADNDAYADFVRRKKKLFEGRKIALVTGKSVLAKLDYDIFEHAASKVIIDAPSKHAFGAYDSILRDISSNVSKDTLICLILGPTATAMAADLTDMGYMAWDIGHIAKDYDAYMKNLDRTPRAQREFFAPD
ncbi:MAG: DUF1792 domain-containing protein [Synergistaceae bacterium]|nr:DUF1792 domain-containing protein [Synergistaceae bacterium]